MSDPRAAAPTPDEPGYFDTAAVPDSGSEAKGSGRRRKRAVLWAFSGLAGLSISVGTLGLLLVQTTTNFGVPSIAAPVSPDQAAPAPSPSTPVTPDAPGEAATPPGEPADGTVMPRTSVTSGTTPRVPVVVSKPVPTDTTDVIVRLTPTKDADATIPTQGLAPGDQVAATVTVRNDGNVNLRYSMVSTATTPSGDLAANAITMVVKVNVAQCNAAGFDHSGSVVYSGPLGSYAGRKVIGDPSRGAQAGDRLLSPGEIETICVNVVMPTNVGNEYQGTSTRVRFRFDSETV